MTFCSMNCCTQFAMTHRSATDEAKVRVTSPPNITSWADVTGDVTTYDTWGAHQGHGYFVENVLKKFVIHLFEKYFEQCIKSTNEVSNVTSTQSSSLEDQGVTLIVTFVIIPNFELS